jgi:hypothetical protein
LSATQTNHRLEVDDPGQETPQRPDEQDPGHVPGEPVRPEPQEPDGPGGDPKPDPQPEIPDPSKKDPEAN